MHRLSNLDMESRSAVCAICGPVGIRKRSENSWRCSRADNKRTDKNSTYRKYVTEVCARCGFVPEHVCQLDVDHIDGNHSNNTIENLQTLCANCHRLKTYDERQRS